MIPATLGASSARCRRSSASSPDPRQRGRSREARQPSWRARPQVRRVLARSRALPSLRAVALARASLWMGVRVDVDQAARVTLRSAGSSQSIHTPLLRARRASRCPTRAPSTRAPPAARAPSACPPAPALRLDPHGPRQRPGKPGKEARDDPHSQRPVELVPGRKAASHEVLPPRRPARTAERPTTQLRVDRTVFVTSQLLVLHTARIIDI